MAMPRRDELLAERLVVALEGGFAGCVVAFDDVGGDELFGHVVSPQSVRSRVASPPSMLQATAPQSAYRVKLCALPASTLTMLPVDLADMSETKK